MKCPFCNFKESKVVDSRPSGEGDTIRRRRECLSCSKRFTTYETIENMPIMVIKRNGRRQVFDRRKILRGMLRACEKRPVAIETIEQIAEDIEQEFQNTMVHEINSQIIGERVMEQLKKLDQVAYVRFASVYRQFEDLDTFMMELKKLLGEK